MSPVAQATYDSRSLHSHFFLWMTLVATAGNRTLQRRQCFSYVSRISIHKTSNTGILVPQVTGILVLIHQAYLHPSSACPLLPSTHISIHRQQWLQKHCKHFFQVVSHAVNNHPLTTSILQAELHIGNDNLLLPHLNQSTHVTNTSTKATILAHKAKSQNLLQCVIR